MKFWGSGGVGGLGSFGRTYEMPSGRGGGEIALCSRVGGSALQPPLPGGGCGQLIRSQRNVEFIQRPNLCIQRPNLEKEVGIHHLFRPHLKDPLTASNGLQGPEIGAVMKWPRREGLRGVLADQKLQQDGSRARHRTPR